MNPSTYTPQDWYWIVGGDTAQVYSSAVGDYVPVSDPAYVAWLARGNTASVNKSEANLGAVLAKHLLRPTPPAMLDSYTDKLATDTVTQVIFKVMFNHENRLRAIERNLGLNGSPANLTPAQAKNAVKALM